MLNYLRIISKMSVRIEECVARGDLAYWRKEMFHFPAVSP